NTFDSNGQKLSTDAKGITGNQVWTYGKKGDNFRTVQLLNLMGINSDWKNEDGSAANKTPDEQTNLTVKYALGDVSMENAQRMANQTYVTSPDDWSKSNLQKVSASVKTDENGKPVLVINVPKLTLWDVVYISNADQESAPEADQAQTPAAQSSDDKVAEN
ncbi:glycoside hydrolase family 66 protein, partial [Larkinella sp. C7]|uniref:glycoside hydrolase family 66 protein n=1 Tax=Larkinella sp. C7 TaxID=2576607 RepID=UPI002729D445